MYEFIKTETGWRVFWGVDPCPPSPPTVCVHNHDNNRDNDNASEPVLLSIEPLELDSNPGFDTPA